MNERLKELEKQSIITIETREISSAWDNDRPPYRYITITETKFSPEKFAELIVQECLDIASEVRGEPASDTHYVIGYDRACEKMIAGIKEHFGIE